MKAKLRCVAGKTSQVVAIWVDWPNRESIVIGLGIVESLPLFRALTQPEEDHDEEKCDYIVWLFALKMLGYSICEQLPLFLWAPAHFSISTALLRSERGRPGHCPLFRQKLEFLPPRQLFFTRHFSPASFPPPSFGHDPVSQSWRVGRLDFWGQTRGRWSASRSFRASTSRDVRRPVSRDPLAIAKAAAKLDCGRDKTSANDWPSDAIRPIIAVAGVPSIERDVFAIVASAADPIGDDDSFWPLDHFVRDPVLTCDFAKHVNFGPFRPTTGRFAVMSHITDITIPLVFCKAS